MDLSNYTISESPKLVSVTEFRDSIDWFLKCVREDYHAAVGPEEKAQWAVRARKLGSALIDTSCKRATESDWIRREMAIQLSTKLLTGR